MKKTLLRFCTIAICACLIFTSTPTLLSSAAEIVTDDFGTGDIAENSINWPGLSAVISDGQTKLLVPKDTSTNTQAMYTTLPIYTAPTIYTPTGITGDLLTEVSGKIDYGTPTYSDIRSFVRIVYYYENEDNWRMLELRCTKTGNRLLYGFCNNENGIIKCYDTMEKMEAGTPDTTKYLNGTSPVGYINTTDCKIGTTLVPMLRTSTTSNPIGTSLQFKIAYATDGSSVTFTFGGGNTNIALMNNFVVKNKIGADTTTKLNKGSFALSKGGADTYFDQISITTTEDSTEAINEIVADVNALPSVSDATIDDASAIKSTVAKIEAIEESQRSNVPAAIVTKLSALDDKMDYLQTGTYSDHFTWGEEGWTGLSVKNGKLEVTGTGSTDVAKAAYGSPVKLFTKSTWDKTSLLKKVSGTIDTGLFNNQYITLIFNYINADNWYGIRLRTTNSNNKLIYGLISCQGGTLKMWQGNTFTSETEDYGLQYVYDQNFILTDINNNVIPLLKSTDGMKFEIRYNNNSISMTFGDGTCQYDPVNNFVIPEPAGVNFNTGEFAFASDSLTLNVDQLDITLVAASDERLKGDINNDKAINANDIILLKKHILGISPLLAGDDAESADMDNDGRLTIVDLVMLKKQITH